MTIGRFSRGIASSLVVLILMTSGSGCFGPFNLTRNVYNWNSGIKGSGEVNEKWMKEIVFFGMIVIPVYMFSALLDAFVFNAIQFWSGSNPVKVTQGPDGFVEAATSGESTIEFSWSVEHRSATVAYRRHGDLMKTVTLEAEGNAYRMIDHGTGASYRITAEAAGIRIVDEQCRLVAGILNPSPYEGLRHVAQNFLGTSELNLGILSLSTAY